VVPVFFENQIRLAAETLDAVSEMEEAFSVYSRGRAVVPPVGEMIFDNPPGDVHIKYGYIRDDDIFVIKIASGFYENSARGLPSGSGMMLVFDQKTGFPLAVLLDNGFLTDVRTAAAGAAAARFLAPAGVQCIGVAGAGTQARMQVEYLKQVIDCRRVRVWGLNEEELRSYRSDMEEKGFEVETTRNLESLAECRLIVTATPSKEPLLQAGWIQPGTHITAMGSDTAEKQELDPHILLKADRVVADSLDQCQSRGEVFQALRQGLVDLNDVLELGAVIQNPGLGRQDPNEITVADLTGVAVQDIQIAGAVWRRLETKSRSMTGGSQGG